MCEKKIIVGLLRRVNQLEDETRKIRVHSEIVQDEELKIEKKMESMEIVEDVTGEQLWIRFLAVVFILFVVVILAVMVL